jgi:predicted GNAT superfamily acetyltransferase
MSSSPAAGSSSSMAGVVIRSLSGAAEFEAAVDLQKSVWHFADRDLVPLSELVAAGHNDGIVLGAFEADRLIAFLFSFVGRRAGHYLQYSRMLAVLPDRQGFGLGATMKEEQKRIALAKGYTRMEWTFDPLEVRNASLNLRRLGARVRTYYRDLYGQRSSRFDLGVPTDRFLAEWDLTEDLGATGEARRSAIARAVPAFEVERRGEIDWPGEFGGIPVGAAALSIPVPSRFQTIRESSTEAALAWRMAVRAAAEAAFAAGYVAVDCVARLEGREGLGAHVLVRE